jgi:hypothetical protein
LQVIVEVAQVDMHSNDEQVSVKAIEGNWRLSRRVAVG